METRATTTQGDVTIRDVARVAGVGKTTVSLVLSNQGRISASTREHVLKTAKQLGFTVNPHARRLSRGRCEDVVGVLVGDLDLGVATQKLKIIQHHLNEAGFEAPVYTAGSPDFDVAAAELDVVRNLCSQRPRAVILGSVPAMRGPSPEVLDEIGRFRAQGGLVVAYDLPTPLDCDRVIFDRKHNTYEATRHVLALGHRRVGFCAAGPNVPHGERVTGYEQALAEFGLAVREDWLRYGGLYEEAGVLLADWYLSKTDRPTAMVIVNDFAAMAFSALIRRAGLRVPEDVSIVGHDDMPMARFVDVPLTTVTHPVERIARGVVDLLLSRVHGVYDSEPREVIIRGELVERESAGPIADGHR